MSASVPESVTRLQAMALVSNTELSAIGHVDAIRHAAENMAHEAFRKLLNDCIETKGDYMGHSGQTLMLDVFVMSPAEFHRHLIEARAKGERDALTWGQP